jgi:MFS family permease
MRAARLVAPFAGAYFLSYLFRTVNAVVGPVLVRELSLSAGAIGLLTGAYFLTFSLAQVPLGVLLDRLGARRVESALLLVAAAGAALFAGANGMLGLTAGRALIGLGVSSCLMASLHAFARTFPPDRQPSLTGWIMVSGGLGNLAASGPLELALGHATWRAIFAGLALTTVAAAAWLYLAVPETPHPDEEHPGSPWRGVAAVFRSPHFWRHAPLGLTFTGGFMAVQGLWSMSWLLAVNGLSPSAGAGHLTAMALAMTLAYLAVGALATTLARRGLRPAHLMTGGVALALCVFLAITVEASPHTRILWVSLGSFSAFGTLAYPLTAAGFPLSLAGRAHTALNLLVLFGAFAVQWGIGLGIDALTGQGRSPASAHRVAFVTLLTLQAASFAWYLAAPRLLRSRAAPGPGARS